MVLLVKSAWFPAQEVHHGLRAVLRGHCDQDGGFGQGNHLRSGGEYASCYELMIYEGYNVGPPSYKLVYNPI